MAYDKVVDSAVLDEGLKQIADAIREKAGTTDALAFPQAMADAIAAIQGGGSTIEPLTISENGTYTAPDGVDGYSPVTVDVKGSGEELVITDFSYFCYKGARLDAIEKIDTSKGITFNNMFASANKMSVAPSFDTSNGLDFSNMFANCMILSDLPNLNTSNGTTFNHMFSSCQRLKSIPSLNTSNGTTFNHMFYGCSELKSIPNLNTSKGTTFNQMFYDCKKLTSVPDMDTSNGTTFSAMFYGCEELTSVPKLDTSKCSDFSHMFNKCKKLTSIPELNVSNATTLSQMFVSCYEIKDLYLYNIRKTVAIGSGTLWGHLLTVDSLVHTIKELCTVTTSQTLTIGSANLEKIAGLYCRITDDTNEKKTMELCESTDEGAMTLSDYASEKNWLIQ